MNLDVEQSIYQLKRIDNQEISSTADFSYDTLFELLKHSIESLSTYDSNENGDTIEKPKNKIFLVSNSSFDESTTVQFSRWLHKQQWYHKKIDPIILSENAIKKKLSKEEDENYFSVLIKYLLFIFLKANRFIVYFPSYSTNIESLLKTIKTVDESIHIVLFKTTQSRKGYLDSTNDIAVGIKKFIASVDVIVEVNLTNEQSRVLHPWYYGWNHLSQLLQSEPINKLCLDNSISSNYSYQTNERMIYSKAFVERQPSFTHNLSDSSSRQTILQTSNEETYAYNSMNSYETIEWRVYPSKDFTFTSVSNKRTSTDYESSYRIDRLEKSMSFIDEERSSPRNRNNSALHYTYPSSAVEQRRSRFDGHDRSNAKTADSMINVSINCCKLCRLDKLRNHPRCPFNKR